MSLKLCYNAVVPVLHCSRCGNEIPEARQLAVPDERLCRSCVEELGDVEPIRGAMVYEHKTGGYLELKGDVNAILNNARKGVHAQLPLASKFRLEEKEIPATVGFVQRTQVENLEPVRIMQSKCHPPAPRISPSGLCLDCALEWYKKDLLIRRS